jgi:hypothetical protein
MKQAIQLFFVASISFLLQQCAPARFVKPLAKKTQAVSFSFGGPLIKFSGAPIPVPFTTLAYGYGISNSVTGFGSLHTTSLLFGNFQSDIGTTIKLYEKENKYGFSCAPTLQLAMNLKNSQTFRVWPSLDVNAYYHLKNKPSYFYTGLNSWVELSSKKAHQEPVKERLTPNLNLGFVKVNKKWTHQFQLSYLGIGKANLPGVVDYIGISGKGTLGFHYALIRIL